MFTTRRRIRTTENGSNHTQWNHLLIFASDKKAHVTHSGENLTQSCVKMATWHYSISPTFVNKGKIDDSKTHASKKVSLWPESSDYYQLHIDRGYVNEQVTR